MEFKEYHGLCKEAKEIRRLVFIVEQNFKDEYDDVDKYALTIVLFDEDKPIGCSRAFFDEKENRYKIGRFALLKEYRGKHLGEKILLYTIDKVKKMGAKEVYLHAQIQARGFYQKYGFIAFGEIGYEEYCPHIWMKKVL